MSASLTPEQLKEFREAFKIFDVDNSETITTDELLLVMKNLGMMATKEEVKEMLSEVDEDGSGEIDFEEFAELMVKQMKQGSEQEVREAFKAYDTENKGYFTSDELLKLLMAVQKQSKDIKISKEEIEDIIKFMERNGRVNFDKFVNEMMNCGEIEGYCSLSLNLKCQNHSEVIVPYLRAIVSQIKDSKPAKTIEPCKLIMPTDRKMSFRKDSKARTISDGGELSSEVISEFREAFSLFDHDGDGTITTSELQTVMERLGLSSDQEQLNEMIREVDADGSGAVDFDEFCVLMQKKIAQETQSELLELFSIWDEAGKGIIESGELRGLLNRVPVRLTRREIDALVDYADTKKNGKINFEGTSHSLQFVKMLS
ncbi:hypothetical protein pdam_00022096 [Pocillopora damicornis]|uniref:EF-hand domain-containing protein n=1 Tax=Pocillopora damicornis TaxID=46731 RepID=A0A3M6UKD5_POCDA|nr:hypothetical protein pdam_00022096 [Pocillopora damicornis]